MGYSIFFEKDKFYYQLPTTPEEIEISSTLAIETFNVLKLGQIAVPTNMELQTYSFECEFPHSTRFYTHTNKEFQNSDYYLKEFEEWRNGLVPIRFIATNEISESINILVLIEELTIKEKAGEEGDKYIAFKLLEYKPFGKKIPVEPLDSKKGVKKKASSSVQTNPKSVGSYVVQKGDTLWSIAKKYYGSGTQYIKIYNSNKSTIKHPNLIYPGQKLKIP